MYDANGNPYVSNAYQPYLYQQPVMPFNRSNPDDPDYSYRQQSVQGQATWTDGGSVTACNIPWSDNHYMTAAVGDNTPYHCGQKLKIRNSTSPGKEITVEVVDQVQGYPTNRINLHRKAFEALGAPLSQGVINIEITPSSNQEQGRWETYLSKIIQVAYPSYSVVGFHSVEKTKMSPTQTKEVYDFKLQSAQGNLNA